MTEQARPDDGQPISSGSCRSRDVAVERKKFQLVMGENPRGPFLRITEEVSGRYNSIVVPLSGVGEFAAALEEAVLASQRQAGAATEDAGRG